MTVETGTFCDHLQERKPPGLWEIVAEGMCVCVLGVGGVGPWLPSGDPEREPGWGRTSCWQKARAGLGGEGPLA